MALLNPRVGGPLAGAPQALQAAYLTDPNRRMAQLLMQQGADTSPVQHWAQGGARLAQALLGRMDADRTERDYQQQAQDYANERQALYAPVMEQGASGPGPRADARMRPATPEELLARAQNLRSPFLQDDVRQIQTMANQAVQDRAKFERDLAARREDRQLQNDFLAAQSREGQAFRAQEAQAARQQAQALADLQRRTTLEAAQLRAGNRSDPLVQVRSPDDPNKIVLLPQSQAAGMEAPPPQERRVNLRSSEVKMQNELMEQIGVAASINADLGAFARQIDEGKLRFGPIQNLQNRAANAMNRSTDESRNYASFMSGLEKLRNDSLRLNTGVQTEGDAQRAWNELFQNINDTKLVRERLQEIVRLNERAMQLRQAQIDTMREEAGLPPLDTSRVRNIAPAVGGGTQGQGGGGWSAREIR